MAFGRLSVFIAITVLCVIPATVNGQTNYLVAAQNAAMAMKTSALYWSNYYRNDTSYRVEFVGTFYLQKLIEYMQDAENTTDGVRAQLCTDTYSNIAWDLVQQGDSLLETLVSTSIGLHQSVYAELIQTNVMTVDWNDFYDAHTRHINQVNAHLVELIDDIAQHTYMLMHETNYIMWDFYDCLHSTIEPASLKQML